LAYHSVDFECTWFWVYLIFSVPDLISTLFLLLRNALALISLEIIDFYEWHDFFIYLHIYYALLLLFVFAFLCVGCDFNLLYYFFFNYHIPINSFKPSSFCSPFFNLTGSYFVNLYRRKLTVKILLPQRC